MDYWNSILLISIIAIVGLSVITLIVGCKIWKNLVITLIISTLITFLVLCAISFLWRQGVYVPWSNNNLWNEILTFEMGLMSFVIGGVSTFIIMLGILISKNNR
ncbi:hypothetical protein [Acinetobacter terrestris]|jgi:hypothetical protein|uniref:Uncharacterized protein n=1 Tax=Acinetobacter terrestris TaxID=2529843 RepID=A0AAW6UT49_9GAMM|nr:hypothetical protein [Acinetobacter terrestris]MDK1683278.1 hypothetical protein [Acinetobacter terrestris]NNH25978.1 hypothetical protein [Acinetobacter terrestris]NNH36662.1 hypothetical protein [Acinetobacter terrestris]TCB48196.1 hypothetical protein E0H83_00200 [Acinetobacter terrestris]TCB52129.1 hypothetical protein E0H84_13355 [Acinetobacter terrestris]